MQQMYSESSMLVWSLLQMVYDTLLNWTLSCQLPVHEHDCLQHPTAQHCTLDRDYIGTYGYIVHDTNGEHISSCAVDEHSLMPSTVFLALQVD